MAKIRKLYDEAIKPDGSKQVIYPITSTRAVYTPTNITVDALLNEGYRFGGVVVPSDYPTFTDQRVFYGASVPGIYTHFGGISVDGGEAIFLMFDGTNWRKGIFGGSGSSNLTGFKSLASISELPLEETTLGYLIEDSTLPEGFPKQILYVWVGEGGDTLEGLYQNCGQLRGASAYESAVRCGYEGTVEEWLNDPVNGIKGNGIQSMSIVGEYSSEDSAVNTYRITPYIGEPFDFEVKNGKGITSVEVVGTPSTAQSAVNTYRITMSDNTTFDFQVKNGTGITTITETPSVANGGTNVIHITLSDGTSYDINVKNGTASDGFFATAALLTAAIPSPNVGDYAFVSVAGDGTFPAYIYVCTTAGTWTNSNQTFTTEVPQVTISQNTPTDTNHTRISVGGNNYDVASVDDFNWLATKEDEFLPECTILTPDILVNTGKYIDRYGVITNSANYGYSDVMQVFAGTVITVSGVGSGIPIFVYCNAQGEFISSATVSSDLQAKYSVAFAEDKYIRLNGRVVPGTGGAHFMGILRPRYQTLPEVFNVVKNQVKKYVYAAPAEYSQTPNSIGVTLNTLTVFDAVTNDIVTISDSTEYVLDTDNRVLVLTEGNTIALRRLVTNVAKNDLVLYVLNISRNELLAGALWEDYIKKTKVDPLQWLKNAASVSNHTFISAEASYKLQPSSLVVTITGVTYLDNVTGNVVTIYADGGTGDTHTPVEFTLNASGRVLVLNDAGNFVIRAASSSIFTTDRVLLVYNTNIYDVVSGELYTDFVKKTIPRRSRFSSVATYQTLDTSVIASITSVTYYDGVKREFVTVNADGGAGAAPVDFTLKSSALNLVINRNGNIVIRASSSSIQFDDILLLSYTTSGYRIIRGELFADYINKTIGWVDNNPTKKFVIAGSAKYVTNANNVQVTLTFVQVFNEKTGELENIYANTETQEPVTYTLNSTNGRYLVVKINSSGVKSIGYRLANSSLVSAGQKDIVLLRYDTNTYKVIGGYLYADYIYKTLSQEILDISQGLDVTQDKFNNAPEYYTWKKMEQFANIKWTPLKPVPKASSDEYFSAGVEVTGMPYSSLAETDKRIGHDVSLHTFMTCLHNPYSLIYTENVRFDHSQSAYGIQYYGANNSGMYMGVVCSGYTAYALGEAIPLVTKLINEIGESGGGVYERVYDQSANGVLLGDVIWTNGHVRIVNAVWRKKGVVTKVKISEEAQPKVVSTEYTAAQLNSYISSRGAIIYRFKDLFKNIHYEPSPFVAVDDEEPQQFIYNDDICTFAGDKAAFREGDLIYIHCMNLNYPQMELYKDDVLVDTITLASDSRAALTSDNLAYAVNLSNDNLGYGKYKARLKNGSNYSNFTEFEIINCTVTLNGNTATFASQNASAVFWEWVKYQSQTGAGINGMYPISGQSGTFSIEGTYDSGYPLLKVLFQGEFGRVAASWNTNQ